MTAATIMNAQPVVLHGTDTIAHALAALQQQRTRSLPVVGARKRFLGQFGMHAVLGLLLPRAATLNAGLRDLSFIADEPEHLRERLRHIGDARVADHLEEAPNMVEPDTRLSEILLVLYRHGGNLAVVDKANGELAGIISPWDILAALGQREQG
jgi:CBS-domain-containing membrane protein